MVRGRNRSFLRLAGLFAAALVAWSGSAAAQDIPAPRLETTPHPAPADRAFDAVFRYYTSSGSVGFWFPPNVQVSGNQITIPFDTGCGFLCPPGMTYKSFPFRMPALPAGTYNVAFVAIDQPIAEFELAVVAGAPAAVSVPGPGMPAIVLLAALFCAVAMIHRRSRLRTSYSKQELP